MEPSSQCIAHDWDVPNRRCRKCGIDERTYHAMQGPYYENIQQSTQAKAMKQYTETYHILQIRQRRNGEWCAWGKTTQGTLHPAELLAYQGRLTEAIETAERIWIENYGNMHGVEFRCVTKTTTITVNAGLVDEGRFATA